MNLYCKLFVDSDNSLQQLLRQIVEWSKGTLEGKTVLTTWGELDGEENEQFGKARRTDEQDGFLHYRYYFDIEPASATSERQYIKGVGELLLHLWSMDLKAAAACDFEESLPNHGGYNPTRKVT
jgi:hypothetical protein